MYRKFKITQYKDLNHTNFTKEKYKLVYLMVGEDPYNALKGNIPIKIGISNKPDKRKEQIKKGLRPKEVVVDGVKQTIHITNPEIFCISLPLAYAEAVEKAAQEALCRKHQKETGASAKISGYNDWFQTASLIDAAVAILTGVEEVEGDISLETAEKYSLAVSRSYNRAHEFFNIMEITANTLPILFAAVSDTSKTSSSDKARFKKSKKKYLFREVKRDDSLPKGVEKADWLTLVISLRNCFTKGATARIRIPVCKKDLIDCSWNLEKLGVTELLCFIGFAMDKDHVAGIGALAPNRSALLLGEPRYGLMKQDGSCEWKNSIDLCPNEWWKIAR